MNKFTIILLLLFSGFSMSEAGIHKEIIHPGIELKPGESKLFTFEASEDIQIGWDAVQEQKCTTHCVRAINKSGGVETSLATDLGASLKYQPVDGQVIIEYKNEADHPVTINVVKVEMTCEAESCAFAGGEEESRWLVFKIDEFTSIETSADESYSVISGRTTGGKDFTVKAAWRTVDDSNFFSCDKTIKNYLDNRTPKEEYSPYILSGNAIDPENQELILKSVDTCAPKAPNFGVPEKNVY